MYRVVQPEDVPALKSLWSVTFGDSEAYAERAIGHFAGPQNVYVSGEPGSPECMVLAVPVQLGSQRGACYCALTTRPDCRGQGLATGLLRYVDDQLRQKGGSFSVLVPAEPSLFAWYEAQGFQKAFSQRRVHRDIKRNIWSQAEFDSVPAKQLCVQRARFCPNIVQLGTPTMIEVLTDLYSHGVTVVSSDDGFGLYFREGETLKFIELMADGDRAAERLMEAARSKEVVVENAEIVVGADQNLFLGEGTREDHGMIRFLGEPFDVTESGLRLLMDF